MKITLHQIKIKDIVNSIKIDSNPEELDMLKKLIKKNVPFTLRGYFSAYLLRELTRKNVKKEKFARKEERRELKQDRQKNKEMLELQKEQEKKREIMSQLFGENEKF